MPNTRKQEETPTSEYYLLGEFCKVAYPNSVTKYPLNVHWIWYNCKITVSERMSFQWEIFKNIIKIGMCIYQIYHQRNACSGSETSNPHFLFNTKYAS